MFGFVFESASRSTWTLLSSLSLSIFQNFYSDPALKLLIMGVLEKVLTLKAQMQILLFTIMVALVLLRSSRLRVCFCSQAYVWSAVLCLTRLGDQRRWRGVREN